MVSCRQPAPNRRRAHGRPSFHATALPDPRYEACAVLAITSKPTPETLNPSADTSSAVQFRSGTTALCLSASAGCNTAETGM